MRATINLERFVAENDAAEKKLAKAITAGMSDTTDEVKEALRDLVRGARLGDRLAKTWQGKTYPKTGVSLHPKGFIWSKAPEIIAFYAEGQDIVPINGHPYLAIPTAAARAITGKKGARLTVAQIEARLKRKIVVIKGKRGNLLGLYDPRTATAKKRGAKRDLVLLYTFVPMVKGKRHFDVGEAVNEKAAHLPANIDRRLSE